jgi:hypothetical protein
MNVRWKFRPLLVLGQLTAQTVGVPEAMALLKEYPNLQAMMQGCVSGRTQSGRRCAPSFADCSRNR